MGMMNNDLGMYRSAQGKLIQPVNNSTNVMATLGQFDDKKKKKNTKTLKEKNEEMKKKMAENTARDKKYRPHGDNVFESLDNKKTLQSNNKSSSKTPSIADALKTGNATNAIDKSKLKVNKKYQKKVNKILGE